MHQEVITAEIASIYVSIILNDRLHHISYNFGFILISCFQITMPCYVSVLKNI
jgi:hypothetical protein